jgi:hypothetical protein
MSELVHIEGKTEIFCENCGTECTVIAGEDASITDVQYCPFCGDTIDKELTLNDENFDDGWQDD